MNPESIHEESGGFDEGALLEIAGSLQPMLMQRYIAGRLGEKWDAPEMKEEKRRLVGEWVDTYGGKTFDLLKERKDIVELWNNHESGTACGEIETALYEEGEELKRAA